MHLLAKLTKQEKPGIIKSALTNLVVDSLYTSDGLSYYRHNLIETIS